VTSQPADDDVDKVLAELAEKAETLPLTMNKRVDLAGSLVIAALGLFVLIVAFSYPTPTVVFDSIGPMGIPKVIGAFLLIGGLVQSVRSFLYLRHVGLFSPEEGTEDEPEHPSSRFRAVWFMAGSFVFLALLEPIGFLILTPLGIMAALWSLHYRNWLWRGIVGVGFTIFAFVLFGMVLGVPLPNGPLGDLLVDLGLVNF
jgi:putative tricarboxylic transport membrane protein